MARTGTPPRLSRDSIDFSELQEQESENPPVPFSYLTKEVAQINNLVSCYMTYTDPEAHKLVHGEIVAALFTVDGVFGVWCGLVEAEIENCGKFIQ